MLNPSDEIKSRLSIVEVIGEYIGLKPAGVNFRALCPFHNEKSPSFIVSPEKQIWHCFGCGKGGDIFTFVMEMEGLSFAEALRLLAPKAGVELKKNFSPDFSSKRNRLLDILEVSKNYYRETFKTSPEAAPARNYLKNRGLLEATIAEWEIGYSPESWDDLIGLLKKRGFSEEEIFLSGMSVRAQTGNRFYNRFRGRIMFPIFDPAGNAVAFSARILPGNEERDKMGKYINSNQTLIYDKSKILFGLDKAKQEIKKNDLAILVEGQMDAITAHEAGFKNVIASSGTALTREQVALLKRYSPNLALAFDADEAGARAIVRGAREALLAEMNVSVIAIPKGKDPDECIRNNPSEWQRAAERRKGLMEYYFGKVLKNFDLGRPEGKREAAKILLPEISLIANPIEKNFWLKELAEKIFVEEAVLRETLARSVSSAPRRAAAGRDASGERPAAMGLGERLSEILIALILKFPVHLSYVLDRVRPDYLKGAFFHSIYRNLAIYYNEKEEIEREMESSDSNLFYRNFKQWLGSAGPEKNVDAAELDRLALLGERDFYDFDIERARNEIAGVIRRLKKNYLLARLKELEGLIAESERKGAADEVRQFFGDFKIISEELRELNDN